MRSVRVAVLAIALVFLAGCTSSSGLGPAPTPTEEMLSPSPRPNAPAIRSSGAPTASFGLQVGRSPATIVPWEGEVYAASTGYLTAIDTLGGGSPWGAHTFPHQGAFTPVVGDGVVAQASGAGMIVFDELTGARLWSQAVRTFSNGSPGAPASERAVRGVPAIGDALVFAGDVNKGIEAFGVRSGSLLWSQTAPGGSIGGIAVAGHEVIVASGKDFGPPSGFFGSTVVSAFDASTGRLLWRTPIGSDISYTPVVADNRIFVFTDLGAYDMYALSASSGKILYKRPLDGTFSAAGVAGNVGYAHVGPNITAIDLSNGKSIWSTPLAGIEKVIVDSGTVMASGGNTVYALSARGGRELWWIREPGSIGSIAAQWGRLWVQFGSDLLRSYTVKPLLGPKPCASSQVRITPPAANGGLTGGGYFAGSQADLIRGRPCTLAATVTLEVKTLSGSRLAIPGNPATENVSGLLWIGVFADFHWYPCGRGTYLLDLTWGSLIQSARANVASGSLGCNHGYPGQLMAEPSG